MNNTTHVTGFFPSLASLRTAHNDLLLAHRQDGSTPEILLQAAGFIRRGQATGAVLDVEDDRWTAQSLLDYWSAILYRSGEEPPDATLNEFDASLAPDLPDDLCPYVGLDAFCELTQDVFFGRERLTATLIDKLHESRWLAVVGPSGSGKSSLVLAALLPDLKQGALPGSETWRYAPSMVPGSDPLANLARVIRWLEPQGNAEGADGGDDPEVQLFHDTTALARLANDSGSRPVVLTVDQFEEVFTLCNDEAVRDAFLAQLINLAESEGPRHTVILTMRTDFESFVTREPDFQPKFEQALVRVTPLNAAELRDAIKLPAEKIGLRFEEGLIDALLEDILGEPAALPLLQFTLLKLWEHREHNHITWEAYRELGGGRLSLAYSADAFYDALIPEEQVTARRILLRLVRPGEGLEVTSNRVRRDTLYQAGEARDRIDRVLDKLIAARLVRLTEGDIAADAQVEVSHEALVRNWPRLVEWLEEERNTIRLRQRVTDSAQVWVSLGRDPGALLPITLLQEAYRVAELSGIEFNEMELEFTQASQQAIDAEREREIARQVELRQAQIEADRHAHSAKRLRLLAAGLALLLLIPVVVIVQELRVQRSAWQPLENFPRNAVSVLASGPTQLAGDEYVYCAGTSDIGIGCSQGGGMWNIYQQDLPTGEPAKMDGATFPGTVRGVGALAIDLVNPNRIFAFLLDGILYRSDTSGLRWQPLTAGLPSGGDVHAEAIASRNNVALVVLDHVLYGSIDAGEHWTAVGQSSTPFWGQVYDLSMSPSSGRIYVATENGLYQGDPAPPWQWQRVVELAPIQQITLAPGGDDTLYLATLDSSGYQSVLYRWSPGQTPQKLAALARPLVALAANPTPGTGMAVYMLLDDGEVVAVSQDGAKRSLGRQPGRPGDLALDLIAVPGTPGADPMLLLGHTEGLLVYTQKIPDATGLTLSSALTGKQADQ